MSGQDPSQEPESATLTRWAAGLRWEDVPEDVRLATALHFVDAYGVALATAGVPFGRRLLASALPGDAGPARVIGLNEGVDSLRSALLNGTLVHGLEFDDTHIPSVIHGSAVALGAALSQAHRDGVTLGDVLTGFLVAWEVMIRLGLLAPGQFQGRGFQTAAVCGAPAAAVAVGRLRGQAPEVMDQAFGVATSFSSGLMAYASDGATVKRTHLGWAAHGGVAAAEFAEAGVTGPGQPVTAKNGFLQVLAGTQVTSDVAGVFGDVGERWHLLDAAYKLYPVCHYIHSYLDLVGELRSRHPLGDIGSIECEVHPSVVPVITRDEPRRRRPRSFEEAQYSLHHAVAVMYLEGTCTIEQLEDPARPGVAPVADRVHAVENSDLEFPGLFPAVVRLRDRDGAVLEQASIRGPRGALVPPSALVAELREKFLGNASAHWTTARASHFFAELTAPDVPVADRAIDWLV